MIQHPDLQAAQWFFWFKWQEDLYYKEVDCWGQIQTSRLRARYLEALCVYNAYMDYRNGYRPPTGVLDGALGLY